MALTNSNGIDLSTHFNNNPGPIAPCNNSTETDWWRVTPYGIVETIKWILKMLVLPGAIGAIIIILTLLTTGRFENFTIGVVYTILTYIGTFLTYIYSREQLLAQYHAIQDEELPPSVQLNQIESQFKIGFVGDIMMMRKYDLKFSNEVKLFFNDVDIIVGNLEGIVTDLECKSTKQAHPKNPTNLPNNILDRLRGLLSTDTQWLLCLSNNHSIDFGNQEFHKSLHFIRSQPNIDVFGRNDVANVFVQGKEIAISSASEWSNQRTWDCISRFRETSLNSYYFQNKFNILYPHWDYENEKYVRRNIQRRAKNLLTGEPVRKLDLIFGHHPHVRQPIVKILDITTNPGGAIVKFWKIIAYSGGNFTSGVTFLRKKKHIHGRILKCEIGPLNQNPYQLAVGKVEWKNTFNEKDNNAKIVKVGIGIVGIERIYIIVIGLIILFLTILLRFLGYL
ncbi:MAG: CapA family protein [Promethearchaeota archaeon]|jgi:hypothetical protein